MDIAAVATHSWFGRLDVPVEGVSARQGGRRPGQGGDVRDHVQQRRVVSQSVVQEGGGA
ncbi:hypothetical protein [Streptomyces sp. NPDC058394]|uniref:hypothetical protein n=1 Tax=unclassified Streptomyces TaxID=2593676 RepID=UPI00364A9F36